MISYSRRVETVCYYCNVAYKLLVHILFECSLHYTTFRILHYTHTILILNTAGLTPLDRREVLNKSPLL